MLTKDDYFLNLQHENIKLQECLKVAESALTKIKNHCEHMDAGRLELCECSTFMAIKAERALQTIKEIKSESSQK